MKVYAIHIDWVGYTSEGSQQRFSYTSAFVVGGRYRNRKPNRRRVCFVSWENNYLETSPFATQFTVY
jgi:hypothetical protein